MYTCVCVFLHIQSPLRKCCSIQSGASGLPYYCAPLVCVSAVMELLAVWRHNKPKTKNQTSKGLWDFDVFPQTGSSSSNFFTSSSSSSLLSTLIIATRQKVGGSTVLYSQPYIYPMALLSLPSVQPPLSPPFSGPSTRGGVIPSACVMCVSACVFACVRVACVCLCACVCVRASLFWCVCVLVCLRALVPARVCVRVCVHMHV